MKTIASSTADILAYARKFLGIPYVWGGTSPGGFDCSGFVQYVYHHFGVDLPRTSQEQASQGVPVGKNQLQPGDLLFYNYEGPNTHVMMYAGNGMQIGARHTGTLLSVVPVDWGNLAHAQRVVAANGNPLTGGGATSSDGSDSGPAYTFNKSTCAWGLSLPSTGLFGIKIGGGGFCVISKTQARAILGGLLITGGSLVMLFGSAALIVYAFKSTTLMSAVSDTVDIIPGVGKLTSKASAKTKEDAEQKEGGGEKEKEGEKEKPVTYEEFKGGTAPPKLSKQVTTKKPVRKSKK